MRRTSTPRTVAASSPSPRRSSRRARTSAARTPTTTTGVASVTVRVPDWTIEPLPHANRPIVSCSNSTRRTVVSEWSASMMAEPASTSRVGPSGPPRARMSTSPAAASPPRNARPPWR
ncbi:Uncharacterised protein [Mycobacteroides abscessus]|nr:Uncharacterised protein [Mycobacteroides abscessus]